MKQCTNNLFKIKAKNLIASDRIGLAIKILNKSENVTQLAEKVGVSRNFLYNQANKAQASLNKTFEDEMSDQTIDNEKVLFYLPVTKQRIRQIAIALALICHSSIRGIVEFFSVIFDYDISVGGVFNILNQATEKATSINEQENFDQINVAALDEIYQNRHGSHQG
jgi:hypothetical protein